ncbi:MAG: hypothetical protein R3F37_19490 [Candidatus Competibacteraceae bacterium]
MDEVAKELRQHHPESFRQLSVKQRNGEVKTVWAFTKTVRLKRYGRKRLVIVHEESDWHDTPVFTHRRPALGKWAGDSGVELPLAD